MSRKKSIRNTAQAFVQEVTALEHFVQTSISSLSDKEQSWCHDYAIIRLYREFENLMLSAIAGAINNDTTTISSTTGIDFPKHLNVQVCEFLVLGGGYFDFKGRSGLIKTLRKYVPQNHYLLNIVQNQRYQAALDKLSALRNYAAHESEQAKKAALTATGQQKIGSAGSWLKRQQRFIAISTELKDLGNAIHQAAPY
jgi:hypothetical protein